MEGNLRRDVMFGMVIHVPNHFLKPLPGQGRPRVHPQIRAFGKTAVLGEVVPATEGLANEAGQQPVNHRRPGAEIDRGYGNDSIYGTGIPRLSKDARPFIVRNEVTVRWFPDTQCVATLPGELPLPVVDCRRIIEVPADQVRFRQDDIRIPFPAPNLRVSVVHGVPVAVVQRCPNVDQGKKTVYGFIHPARPENRAMAAIVNGSVNVHHYKCVQQHCRHYPPCTHGEEKEYTTGNQRRHMHSEVHQTMSVRPPRKWFQLLAGDHLVLAKGKVISVRRIHAHSGRFLMC